jgi:mannosidase alpha-like ER degradation enhancer 2
MKKIINLLIILIVILTSCNFVKPSQQKNPASTEINKDSMAQVVKQEILHAWNGYMKFAWGHDDLRPLTAGYHDWYKEPFYMTAFDGLDLLYLIGEKQEAEKTKEYILRYLSFDKDIYVKGFEINIRLLGSLLANYEITGDKRLLILAEDLGKRLLYAHKSPTNMPYVMVNLKTGRVKDSITNPAEVGSALLEMGILSRHTGKKIIMMQPKKPWSKCLTGDQN